MMQINFLRVLRSPLNVRSFSAAQTAIKEVDWNDAKPLSEIPGPKNMFQVITKMMPGGKYYKKPLNELLQLLRNDYGPICTFPGMQNFQN